MTMRPATPDDVDHIMRLRAKAARWLASIGSDQWSSPWPSGPQMRATIAASIDRGETWMAVNDDQVLGTVALDGYTAPNLWTPAEIAQPARYVHRLIIDRQTACRGTGAAILEWCANQARAAGAQWLRADVWTTNHGLHDYYRGLGWQHVRTVVSDDYPSGALFQLQL